MFRTYSTSLSHGGQNAGWQYIAATAEVPKVSQISLDEKKPSESLNGAETSAQGAYGFIYHTGPQCLSVSVPGDVAPVRFGCHTVLSGIKHEDQSPEIVIDTPGFYEITYSLNLSASTAVHATFALQANGEHLPGSLISRIVSPEERIISASVMTALKQNTTLRLIMTSGSAFSAELSGSGVSASMMIKKLNNT